MQNLLKHWRPSPAAAAGAVPVAGDATRTLETVLQAAAAGGASDVHLEPKADSLVVRFRVDGEMREHARFPFALRDALLARGKILGGMDITEKRLPQDGRAVLNSAEKRFYLRLSTVPTVHGESLVVRLLDQSMPAQPFGQLGLTGLQEKAVRDALGGPAGLIFLTGPTGSGKTTTLHAALHTFDHQARVIHTLEEPVEYEFTGIRQTEIREKIGLTFAGTLRALLRQNPDVLLVGETRDAETAQLAIRAALTGHLVLSTLHTNDALAVIPRLLDLGVEPFLLAAALRLVGAQRLVRRLCPNCKAPHPDEARLRQEHRLPDGRFLRAVGCTDCHQKGFRGRLAIHEVVPAGRFLPLIAARAPLADLAALRDREGLATLWQHGLAAAGQGLTTIEEVARVL